MLHAPFSRTAEGLDRVLLLSLAVPPPQPHFTKFHQAICESQQEGKQ